MKKLASVTHWYIITDIYKIYRKIVPWIGNPKSLWRKLSGYSKRVTVKTAIARWKKLFNGYLESRGDKRQHIESILKSLIINNMKEQKFLIG